MAKFLTLARSAALLGMSEQQLNVWIANGWLHPILSSSGDTVLATDDIRRAGSEHGIDIEHEQAISTAWLEQQVLALADRVSALEEKVTPARR